MLANHLLWKKKMKKSNNFSPSGESVMDNKNLTLEQLDREINYYLRDEKAPEPFFRLHRELFKIGHRYSAQMKNDHSGIPENHRQLFREGRCLLSETTLTIDPALFRTILGEIVEAFVSIFPQAETLCKIMELPELSESRLPPLLAGGALLDSGELEKLLRAWGWKDEEPVDSLLITGLARDALAPFYICFAQAVGETIDFALWGEGCCPVCGQNPGMAMLDHEGVRNLECCLCNTNWQFPRLECPFCRNKDPQQLGYFYADDYPGRRVQICERCKSYLKTAVVKELGRDVLLNLEEIYTMDLDILAKREGYRAGRDLAVLR